MKKQINIVLCMNTQEESKNLELQFLEINSDINVYVCDGENELVECFTNNDINCFVFEYNCHKFNEKEIASKLGKTARFNSASFIFVTDKERISDLYEVKNLKIDMVITRPFKMMEYAPQLSCIWKRQSGKVIPEEYSILILDNNPRIIEVLKMHMEHLHHENYDTCYSVGEAKDKLIKKDYDLLILDWDLDDGTCMEVIAMTRASTSSPRLKDALTIVMTGRDSVEDIMTLVDNNIKDHIIKPFDHHEFENKISYALERHHKRLR